MEGRAGMGRSQEAGQRRQSAAREQAGGCTEGGGIIPCSCGRSIRHFEALATNSPPPHLHRLQAANAELPAKDEAAAMRLVHSACTKLLDRSRTSLQEVREVALCSISMRS